MKLIIRLILLSIAMSLTFKEIVKAQNVPKDLINPPHEFSVMPFWFWNDTLKDEEIIRRLAILKHTVCMGLLFIRVSGYLRM